MKYVVPYLKLACIIGLFYQLHALHAGTGTYFLAVGAIITWTVETK
jgi:hypothetical protein